MNKRKSGFTLLEMMIAFVILSIAVTSIYKSLTTGLTAAQERLQRYDATEIAISVIAELEVIRPLAETQGKLGDIWRWTAKIEPAPPNEFIPDIQFTRLKVQVFYRSADAPTAILTRILPAEVPR